MFKLVRYNPILIGSRVDVSLWLVASVLIVAMETTGGTVTTRSRGGAMESFLAVLVGIKPASGSSGTNPLFAVGIPISAALVRWPHNTGGITVMRSNITTKSNEVLRVSGSESSGIAKVISDGLWSAIEAAGAVKG